MFHQHAEDVVAFAMKGPLLQPQSSLIRAGRHGLIPDDLDEAFRLYGLPVRKPHEAVRMGLVYLPDAVFAEQGKLLEFGIVNSPYREVASGMQKRIGAAVAYRIGKSNPDLDNEVDGALCAILEVRLARGNGIPLIEELFSAYLSGCWPFAIRRSGKVPKLAVYVGGVKADNPSLEGRE